MALFSNQAGNERWRRDIPYIMCCTSDAQCLPGQGYCKHDHRAISIGLFSRSKATTVACASHAIHCVAAMIGVGTNASTSGSAKDTCLTSTQAYALRRCSCCTCMSRIMRFGWSAHAAPLLRTVGGLISGCREVTSAVSMILQRRIALDSLASDWASPAHHELHHSNRTSNVNRNPHRIGPWLLPCWAFVATRIAIPVAIPAVRRWATDSGHRNPAE